MSLSGLCPIWSERSDIQEESSNEGELEPALLVLMLFRLLAFFLGLMDFGAACVAARRQTKTTSDTHACMVALFLKFPIRYVL